MPPSTALTVGARCARAPRAAALLLTLWLAGPAWAHDATFPIQGDKLSVDADGSKSSRKFTFKATGDEVIRIANHDPTTDGAALVINGMGKKPSSSGLITLKPEKWERIEDDSDELIGWRYVDKKGKRGGITKVILKNGKLQVKGKGENFAFRPKDKSKEVWVTFYFEEEQYCAVFAKKRGANVSKDKKGEFKASAALQPGACQEQVCGNGRVELGEECDDGNLAQKDGCRNDCTIGVCKGEAFASTYDAIQDVIFDSPVYKCTNDICHDSVDPAGELDLSAGVSFDNLIDVASDADPDQVRIFPGDIEKSLLYQKLLAKLDDEVEIPGSPMPVGGSKISEAHLEGLADWVRSGAPESASVQGTQDNFGTCLPPAEPLKIDPPPVPENGVQLISTAWDLPQQSEDEICMATYYDFTGTDLIPESAKVPCPEQFTSDPDDRICAQKPMIACTTSDDCNPGVECVPRRNAVNDDSGCFAWNYQELVQDAQSHHSIIFIYTGAFDQDQPSWGPWTYKPNDASDPDSGQPCDPNDIDPTTGVNNDCSGHAETSIACIGLETPDTTNFTFGGDGGTLPQFSGSQETYYELDFSEGVYSVLPMKGIVVWNSHAFNLTDSDSTMNQYLNLEFANGASEQQYASRQLFDAGDIFTHIVPPFEKREYCSTSTMPRGTRQFRLTSHMHERGVLWRTWAPPNTPCRAECPEGVTPFGCKNPGLPVCDGPPDPEADGYVDPIYTSSVYNDPLQLDFDPPLAFDSADDEDRTWLYCAEYDNGSTPDGPPVKTFSGSPDPPPELGGIVAKIGGPCLEEERACMDGPNKGVLCDPSETGGQVEATFCETSPGAGDGVCDACPLRGGVTTADEMFINLGNYYVVSPEE
ncbi:MAG: hypothetical protein ACQGVK_20080 [Myxococcota bacterium]